MLYGEVSFEKGEFFEQNFDMFNLMWIVEMLIVEMIVMLFGGFWGGVGELIIVVVLLVVLNVIFVVMGKCVRNFLIKD